MAMPPGTSRIQHALVELPGLPRYDRRACDRSGHVRHRARHADDVTDRHQRHQKLHRKTNRGEHGRRGHDRSARHARGTDRRQQSDHRERHIAHRRIPQSERVDGEHGRQHRPHTSASRHADGRPDRGGEVRHVRADTDRAELPYAQRQRRHAGLRGERRGLRRQHGLEERQGRHVRHEFQQQPVDDERLDDVEHEAQHENAQQREQRVRLGCGRGRRGRSQHHHRVRGELDHVADGLVDHALGLLEEPLDDAHVLLPTDRHDGDGQHGGRDDDGHHTVAGQVSDDVLREEVEYDLVERRCLRGEETGGRLVVDEFDARADVQRDGHTQRHHDGDQIGEQQPADRPQSDAAQLFQTADVGDAGDDRHEDQRRDQRGDQVDVDVAQQVERVDLPVEHEAQGDAQPKREHRQQAEVEFEDRAQHGDQGEQHHGRRPDRHCGGIDVG